MLFDAKTFHLVWPLYLAAVAGGYLLGSIPFGLILTRAAGLGDIRAIGSGNIGATNVLRTGRKGLALATLLLDGGKGALALFVALWWRGPDVAVFAAGGAPLARRWQGAILRGGALAGLGALLAFLGFRAVRVEPPLFGPSAPRRLLVAPIENRTGDPDFDGTLEEVLAAGDRALVFTQFRQMGKLLQAMLAHRLDRERMTIGAKTDCEVVIGGKHVSDRHASLRFRDGVFYLTDLDSTNGTFVGGERIEQRSLQDGDRVRFGSSEWVFKCVTLEREPA